MMYNWIGQEIKVGSIVGRGARDGNSSTFKIGRVTKINPDKNTARVEWQYASRAVYKVTPHGIYNDGSPKFLREGILGFAPSSKSWGATGVGSPSVESLFVLPDDTLERAGDIERLAKVVDDCMRDGQTVTQQQWLDYLANV